MHIATYNVNSVKARLEALVAWLEARRPDVVCLQELKCEDAAFPREPLEALGYNIATHGQKTYNGVAVLSRIPFDEIRNGLPGMEDDPQARWLETVIAGTRIVSLYLPNGNPVDTEKFPYKLRWMAAMKTRVASLLLLEEPLVLAGDFNVIPNALDARDIAQWSDDALWRPETRAAFRTLMALGLTDAVRTATPDQSFTFWDYQAGAWQKNNGIRIDHILLSPQAADRYKGFRIDTDTRAGERPSDHVPVVVELG